MSQLIRDSAALLAAFIGLLYLHDSWGRTPSFDERKWERIEQNRKLRLANEARYETCVQACRQTCLTTPKGK